MLKKISIMSMIILLLNLFMLPPALAADKLSKEAKRTAKVKAGIAKLGTGKDARIKVKLKDGTKLRGYVSEISEDSFTVTDDETGVSTSVPYPSAKQVRGNNLSSEIWIGIGVFVFIVVLIAAASGS